MTDHLTLVSRNRLDELLKTERERDALAAEHTSLAARVQLAEVTVVEAEAVVRVAKQAGVDPYLFRYFDKRLEAWHAAKDGPR